MSSEPVDSAGGHGDRPWPARLLPAAAWHEWWRTACVDDGPLIQTARSQGWVVSRGQTLDLGVADHDLRRWVRRGHWSMPRHGAASPIVPGDDLRRGHALAATSAVLVRPDHVVSGRSAAILHGLPTVRVPPAPEITRRTSTTGRRAGAHVYGATLTTPDIVDWFGAPVTSVARTLVDLGRHDVWDAIMAADAALRERLVSTRQVSAALDRAAGWPGVRAARAVLAHADPRAESPLESLTRWRLTVSSFPAPELQWRIGNYFADLCWPGLHLVIECDGSVKYRAGSDALWQEKKREAALRRHGYRVDRVIWSDVTRDWSATYDRLAIYFR